MRKIKKGWQQFGVEDPLEVVFPSKVTWLPRYYSEPNLSKTQYNDHMNKKTNF